MVRISLVKKIFCRRGRHEDGFTLIEVLVALTIFAIGLLALAGMQVTGIQGNARSQSLSAKVALADGVIEEFLAMDGDDPRLTNETPNIAWPTATDVDVDGAGTISALVNVDSNPLISGVTYTDLSQVTVIVTNQIAPAVTKTVMKRRY